MAKVRRILIEIWSFGRELLGDNAYARYRDYVAARGGCPLTPQEFYLSELQRKYSRPSRCC
ncbi:MAG: putative selenoprotein [Acidobacteriia bacterium]|nr:putative selenoprotein [Terriglobia bacterium]